MAAGYGTSPYLVFAGTDGEGEYFQMVELLFGGLPGRPAGDGLDGHSWWPMFRTTPAEYMESYYPVVLERYEPVIDTGGPGLHRGGTGIEKQYMFRCSGAVTVNDDRELLSPWGLGGAKHGGQSSKTIVRADGTRERLPSKIDNVSVGAGDRILFRSLALAGGATRSSDQRGRSSATCAAGSSARIRPSATTASCPATRRRPRRFARRCGLSAASSRVSTSGRFLTASSRRRSVHSLLRATSQGSPASASSSFASTISKP